MTFKFENENLNWKKYMFTNYKVFELFCKYSIIESEVDFGRQAHLPKPDTPNRENSRAH